MCHKRPPPFAKTSASAFTLWHLKYNIRPFLLLVFGAFAKPFTKVLCHLFYKVKLYQGEVIGGFHNQSTSLHYQAASMPCFFSWAINVYVLVVRIRLLHVNGISKVCQCLNSNQAQRGLCRIVPKG